MGIKASEHVGWVVKSFGKPHMTLLVDGIMQVTDLTLARENQTSFEEYFNDEMNSNPGIDLTVTVLTTGFWPSYKSSDLALPAEMVRLLILKQLLILVLMTSVKSLDDRCI